MSKMIDLGFTYDDEVVEAKPSKRGKKQKRYPTVWLNNGQKLPLSASDVGKTFTVTAIVRLTGVEERVRDGQKGRGKEFNMELRSMEIKNDRQKLKTALRKNART